VQELEPLRPQQGLENLHRLAREVRVIFEHGEQGLHRELDFSPGGLGQPGELLPQALQDLLAHRFLEIAETALQDNLIGQDVEAVASLDAAEGEDLGGPGVDPLGQEPRCD
jgi:hypothetical protein